jgi:tRNA dimethylallyltransferase
MSVAMNKGHLPKLALIAGPTASGKSALALILAERHRGTVINADSAQVYRDLRVLSARPSVEEEERVPHRLFGYIDGAESCSAARWASDARGAIDETIAEERLPILVGGTGLYLRTLLDGIAPVPEIDLTIREAVRALPVADAYARLEESDPVAAAKLNPGDTIRVARALEVALSTGRPLAAWQSERSGGIGNRFVLAPLILLPDRDWLIARCDKRLATMFEQGAIEEIRALLAQRHPASSPVMRAIGVPDIAAMLAGEIDETTALERVRLATRQYAKRQYTWFRNQPPPDWTRSDATDTNVNFNIIERLLYQ